ncbi:unnamed protein product [Phytophthora fragariaefolia]|uniref:Unnamed protein product n=1 Tax=Phytophthora fragariaefolia TaxID=1490495 RepID=A0A9W6TSD3_9STRA|nr:unnamed protein product [Phytophthora fragariaefolia]
MLRQDIEYSKIEVNPDAEIAWPGVCQLSFQPTARGSGKQGKEYTPPRQPQAKIDIGLRVQINGTQDRRLNHTLTQRVEISPLLSEFPLPARINIFTEDRSTPSVSQQLGRRVQEDHAISKFRGTTPPHDHSNLVRLFSPAIEVKQHVKGKLQRWMLNWLAVGM